jgi:hypothetical protein
MTEVLDFIREYMVGLVVLYLITLVLWWTR